MSYRAQRYRRLFGNGIETTEDSTGLYMHFSNTGKESLGKFLRKIFYPDPAELRIPFIVELSKNVLGEPSRALDEHRTGERKLENCETTERSPIIR